MSALFEIVLIFCSLGIVAAAIGYYVITKLMEQEEDVLRNANREIASRKRVRPF